MTMKPARGRRQPAAHAKASVYRWRPEQESIPLHEIVLGHAHSMIKVVAVMGGHIAFARHTDINPSLAADYGGARFFSRDRTT
jgi:hypothetical protein